MVGQSDKFTDVLASRDVIDEKHPLYDNKDLRNKSDNTGRTDTSV